jgi:hypothetical protein
MFKAFIVGSQIAQLREQMRTNKQLDALRSHQLNQTHAQDRLNWIREQVFIVRKNFESAAALLTDDPARALFICECNLGFLQREGISTESFDELADKEYFRRVSQYGKSIRDHARPLLSQETINKAHRAARIQAILPQLRGLSAWTEIAELLPDGVMKRQYSRWQIPYHRWSMILCSLFLFPFVLLPLFIWATDPYPKLLPKIRRLAQSVGGWVSDHVTRNDALSIAGQYRAVLEWWGLYLPADSKGLKNAVAEAEKILADFARLA